MKKKIGFIKDKSEYGKVKLHIVIDENGIDGMLSSLAELADDSNSKSRVQDSMRRFKLQEDINQNIYYYDEISVYSGESFLKIINSYSSK